MDEQDPTARLTHAFEALRDRLLGTAFHVLGDREDAREVVQDAFLKCWRRRSKLDQVGNLDGWIFSVLMNAARDRRRRRRLRRTDSLPTEERMHPSASEPPPHRIAAGRETVERLRHAIQQLPDAEREVFLLRQNADLTFRALADSLGIPEGTAKTRMRTALRRLRDAIDPAVPGSRPEVSR